MTASLHLVTTTPRPAHLIRVAVPRLNKCDHISEYLPQMESRDYDLEWAEVTETRRLTCAEWDALMTGLLTDRGWLAGKGGTRSWDGTQAGAYLLVVAAVAPTGTTVYIDPQGLQLRAVSGLPWRWSAGRHHAQGTRETGARGGARGEDGADRGRTGEPAGSG